MKCELRASLPYRPGLIMKEMEKKSDCVICFLPLSNPRDVRSCTCSSGQYHKACILEWLIKYKSCCPLCLRNGKEIVNAKDFKHVNVDKELVSAVVAQRAEFVKLLLSFAANPNQTCQGKTTLLEHSFFEHSNSPGKSLQVSRALLECPRTKPQKIVEFVVCHCWDTGCLEVLVEHGIAVDGRDSSGKTPLLHAVERCQMNPEFHACETRPCIAVQFVEKLLELGADVHTKDKEGHTALMLALDHTELVRLLLKHGADVNAKDLNGDTALAHASHLEVREMLLKHGAIKKARTKPKSKLRRIGLRVKQRGFGLDKFQLPKLRKRKHSWQFCGSEE